MLCVPLPRTIMGYVVRCSGRHQIGLALLAVGVFGLSSVPLEIQRRIVNDAIKNGATGTIVWLALAYAGVGLLEQVLKMSLNLYRAWVSEDAVRSLRQTLRETGRPEPARRDADAEGEREVERNEDGETGTHAAMVVAEAEPIGGFVGMAISEPLLQTGILVSVIGYMTVLEPWTLLLSAGFLLPQMLFVPFMQHAINTRAADRIKVMRLVGTDIVETGLPEGERIERVFELNMGIYKIKYSMNLAMNFMYYAAIAIALGVGGLFAVEGHIQVGTVVAVVSGLGKLNDPWGDLVNWGRELSVDSVKYRLFADAVRGRAQPHARRGLVTA
ncbi:MAG: ABC transporter ATP-binding protein [Alphaproteobacteria bacterium]|nr:ABC transporter ATP-binding protein [Alphaproteobacteria bacterium]